MMTRAQRIDYELLDCAIHGFRDSRGYATAATTTVPAFLKRLRVRPRYPKSRTTSPMSPSGIPESRPPNRVTIPRWMAVILALLAWLIAIPLAHGVVPWAIS